MKSDTVGGLVKALVAAQKEIKPLPRNREVEVTPRNGGKSYKFSYTTLDELIEHVREPLTTNGLWFTQTLEAGVDGQFVLRTTLYHESGEFISGTTPMVDPGNYQQMGSALSYQRRYALAAILGLSSELDDDGNAADGNTITTAKDNKPQTPRQQAAQQQKVTATENQQATQSEAARAAIAFGNDCLFKLVAIRDGHAFDLWHTSEVQRKIEKLKSYDPALYDLVKAKISKVLDEINTVKA